MNIRIIIHISLHSFNFYLESQKKDAKKLKEQQKKQLRKAKQLFRKLTMAAYQAANPNDSSIGNDAVWDDLEKMNDDVSSNMLTTDMCLFDGILTSLINLSTDWTIMR